MKNKANIRRFYLGRLPSILIACWIQFTVVTAVQGQVCPGGCDDGEVCTSDIPPLVLTDYLPGTNGDLFVPECTYIFSVNGTVTKVSP